ncbi:lytic transglycosylase domain-containing protein [Simkania negevensis]|uniref:Lytic transglycosylase domain-containing protein n=1 Tax=Simkania negevensis TaxID=83561 RepID=A0ABS3AQY8_9BACT|nr:lytic transglycosylase domain-containing protein [Simkania negevensis]
MVGRRTLLLSLVCGLVCLFAAFLIARECLFPLRYREVVVRQGHEWRLNPLLVAAVISRESSFSPLQVSMQGDRGLMQLQPTTIEELQRVGIISSDEGAQGDVFDPAKNIRYGTAYLRYLYDRFGGSDRRMEKVANWYGGDATTPVLHSYNAGPTLVLSIFDGVDDLATYQGGMQNRRPTTVEHVKDVLWRFRCLKIMNRIAKYE